MAAPIVYLDPNMMSGILLYGFAGALSMEALSSCLFHSRQRCLPSTCISSEQRN